MRVKNCRETVASQFLPRGIKMSRRALWETKTEKNISHRTSAGWLFFGNGPNTVSESTHSNTELSEFFGAHRVPGGKLSEFLSAYYLCAKANSPSLLQNSPSLLQNSVSSLIRNSTLETVFPGRFADFPGSSAEVSQTSREVSPFLGSLTPSEL